MNNRTKFVRKRLLLALAILIGAAGTAVLYYCNPAETAWMPQCPSYFLFGLHCSGCGTTRAIHALLHGDLVGAMRKNLLFLPAVILIIALWFKPQWSWNRRIVYSVLIVITAYTVLRNIPCYPFSLLAPH